jgi:AcrR family transcriptional regulator
MGSTSPGGTYDKVLQGSLELFVARGFGGTGIRDIATAAGLKTSGLYHYMNTKEDLLLDIIQRGLTASIAAANETIAGEDDAAKRLAMLTASAVVLHAEYRRAYLVIDNEFHFLQGDTLMSVKELRDIIDRIWQDTLRVGVDQGAFALIDQRVVRLALLSMCRGVADWYSPTGENSVPELAEKMSCLALDLVGVDRDRKPECVPTADSWIMRRIIHIVHSTHADVPH